MAQGHRPSRVGEQIREELSTLLSRGTVHDPGIGFITLTRVQVSPDLALARVFYTSLGDPKARRETEKALERATPFLGGRSAAPSGCAGCPSSSSDSTSRSPTRTASSRFFATSTRRRHSAPRAASTGQDRDAVSNEQDPAFASNDHDRD